MFPICIWILCALAVSGGILALGGVFSKAGSYSVSALSSFECGIDPLGSCRVPFALHFFLVGVVFVIFDAEMLLALPLVFTPVSRHYWLTWVLFLGLLYVGLLIEFIIRTIDWNE